MPVLANPRHERFAQELAKGKTADEAYKIAGFKPHRGNASTLRSNQSVLERLAELQKDGAERAAITLEWLTEKAEEARKKAMDLGMPAAAISAIKEIGVLTGLRVQRAEVGAPGDFARMSDAELDGFIAERAGTASARLPGERATANQGVAGRRERLN